MGYGLNVVHILIAVVRVCVYSICGVCSPRVECSWHDMRESGNGGRGSKSGGAFDIGCMCVRVCVNCVVC